jgi:hypothetical protein
MKVEQAMGMIGCDFVGIKITYRYPLQAAWRPLQYAPGIGSAPGLEKWL